METRRVLEGEFHTARERSTPGGTPTIVIGGNLPTAGSAGTGDMTLSRKRRLTTASMASIGDDPTVIIRMGDRDHGGHTGQMPTAQVNPEALLEENERLRFELENAKSLQEVLENTLSGLRDQLVKEKLMHTERQVDGDRSLDDAVLHSVENGSDDDERGEEDSYDDDTRERTTEGAEDSAGEADDAKHAEEQSDEDGENGTGDYQDYRTARIDLSNALEKVASLEGKVSKLELALSTAQNSKDAMAQENEALQTALKSAQADIEQAAAKKNELKAQIATLEGQMMAPGQVDPNNDSSNAFETTLKLQVLEEKLSTSQANLAATTRSLDDARSKVRQLEQTLETQDDEHLSYLQTKDELAGWKTIFKYLDPNPTPTVLLNHIQELEANLERERLTNTRNLATSPRSSNKGDPSSKPSITTEDLENNVVSLEQENLQLHQRVKSLKAQLEDAEAANARLAHKIGNGAFNPETTKVLHLKRNPFADSKLAQMQVELDTLRGENQVLKARCARHDQMANIRGETGGTSGLGGHESEARDDEGTNTAQTPSLQLASLQGKLTATEQKLATSEKATNRLQQVFSQQIATFRESIALLFGWNLDMTTDPNNRNERARFTLSLRGQKHHRLCFRLADPSALTLIDTPFSKKHQKEVDTCIVAMKSIPLFIANITLDQIQKM